MIKLLPCPFCGSDAHYNPSIGAVFCWGCDAMRTGVYFNKSAAIDKWNKREVLMDNTKRYVLDGTPVSAVELIEKASESDETYARQAIRGSFEAACVLRRKGHVITDNEAS